MGDGARGGDVGGGGPVRWCPSPAPPFIWAVPAQAVSRGSRPRAAEDLQVVGDHSESDPALHAGRSAVPAAPQPMTARERADAPLAARAPAQRGAGGAGD